MKKIVLFLMTLLFITACSKNEFTSSVIDEVHHASAVSYRKVMAYFEPEFWLGMTATPDRTDTGNIYELFDHNIAYEIRLQQALENDLLCPFHYFGITDIAFDANADADQLIKRAEQGDYSIFNLLTSDERADYVIRQAAYYGCSGDRDCCFHCSYYIYTSIHEILVVQKLA